MIDLADFMEDKTKESCDGAIFRADVQNYRTKRGGFGFTIKLNPVKKLSCPGCEKCGWQDFEFGEVCNDWPINGIESVEHGELYIISVCNESTDWETGQIDDWELCVEKFDKEV